MKVNVRFKLVVVLALPLAFPMGTRAGAGEAAIKRKAMQSSTITSAGYLRGGGVLEIEFRSGAVYRYRGVPRDVFIAFSKAESKGRFFGSEIRGKYSFEKTNGVRR